MKEQFKQYYKGQLAYFKEIKESTSMLSDYDTWSRANKEVAVLTDVVGDDD